MTLTNIATAINLALILGLMYVYLRNLRMMRSGFVWGLLLFTIIFLVQNAVALYFFITMMPYFAAGTEGWVFSLTLLQTIAFSVLSYITWK